MKMGLLGICFLVWGVCASQCLGEVEGKIEFNIGDKQFVYAGNQWWDKVVVSKSQGGEEFFINGISVYKYYPPVPMDTVFLSENDFSKSPFFNYLIKSGQNFEEAKNHYIEKAGSFKNILFYEFLKYDRGEKSLAELRLIIEEWLENDSNRGIFENVRVDEFGVYYTEIANGIPQTLLKGFVADSDYGLKDFNEFSAKIKRIFETKGAVLLYVCPGGLSVIRGNSVKLAIDQIDAYREAQVYKSGPIRESILLMGMENLEGE